MFSGIIEEIGTLRFLNRAGSVSKLRIIAPKIAACAQLGQSICVNGVCLTVVEIDKDLLGFEVISETIRRTNLRLLQQKDRLNLERALLASGRIDGHFVTGHIDGTGIIRKRQRKSGDTTIEVESAKSILRFIALKGSVALDGVSLTVSALKQDTFAVNIIPYTLNNTTLGSIKEQAIVNIECDILAKYTDRLGPSDKQSSNSGISPIFLKKYGFA